MRRPCLTAFNALLIAAIALSGPALAWSQQAPAATASAPYHVDLAIDLPLALGSGIIAASMDLLVKPQLPGPWCGTSCDASTINGLDEGVVDNHTGWARTASDGLIVATLASPFVLGLVDTLQGGASWGSYGEDALIVFETLMLNFLVNDVVKYSVRRPRPLVYDPTRPDDERTAPDSALSFYSLHASFAFAAATSYSSIFATRNPNSDWVVPVWVSTHVLAATTAYLRVEAGKHFWTDVIVGSFAGVAMGLLVPYLHRSTTTSSGQSQALQAQPMFTGNGLGVSVTW